MPLLHDILILLGFSVVIVFVLQRLKLPSIIGFLLTGVIIGPHGLSLIEAVEQVEILSEVGVILLLFVIGMELSIKQLVSIKKTVFIGGFLQVGLTVGVAALVYNFLGNSWSESVFVGFSFFVIEYCHRIKNTTRPPGNFCTTRPKRFGHFDFSGHHCCTHDACYANDGR